MHATTDRSGPAQELQLIISMEKLIMSDLLSAISVLVLVFIFRNSSGGGIFSDLNNARKDEDGRSVKQKGSLKADNMMK